MLSPDATPGEVSIVKDHLNAKIQRRDALQPAMQVLSATLLGLTAEHELLSREIDFASASIAPVRKLPLETLSNIFELCALNDDEAPLSLYMVCRKWKNAAMSPRVWSHIVIDLDDEWAEEKASVYLKRSRNCMLHVDFRRPGCFSTGIAESGWGAWFHVLMHAARWRTLEISASTFDEVNEVLKDLPMFAPNLAHMTISVAGVFFARPSTQTQYCRLALTPQFMFFPQFRSLRLHAWALPHLQTNHPSSSIVRNLTTLHLSDTFATTFPQTTFLRLHPICGNAISAFLGQCIALETFVFDARDSVGRHSGQCCRTPPGSVQPVSTLPALKNLVLTAHLLDVFAIMDHLTLPALRTAHIDPLPQYTIDLAEKFSDAWRSLFLRSNEPLLEELRMFGMNPVDVVWTLERVPRLTSLHVAYCTSPAPVLNALAACRGDSRPGVRWLCPLLRRLSFADCLLVQWRTVARFIRVRHRAYLAGREVQSMVDLVVNGHDVFEDRDLDSLTQFKLWQITTLIEP